VARLTR
jgi:catechol 2,3-dioxygenase-like lactoylglutathione lyase family enzyme